MSVDITKEFKDVPLDMDMDFKDLSEDENKEFRNVSIDHGVGFQDLSVAMLISAKRLITKRIWHAACKTNGLVT